MDLEADSKVYEALAMFADEKGAHRYLERVLSPNGVCCPRCRSAARVGKLDGPSTRFGHPQMLQMPQGLLDPTRHVHERKPRADPQVAAGDVFYRRRHQDDACASSESHSERVVQDCRIDDASHWRGGRQSASDFENRGAFSRPSSQSADGTTRLAGGRLAQTAPGEEMIGRLLVPRVQMLPAPPSQHRETSRNSSTFRSQFVRPRARSSWTAGSAGRASGGPERQSLAAWLCEKNERI